MFGMLAVSGDNIGGLNCGSRRGGRLKNGFLGFALLAGAGDHFVNISRIFDWFIKTFFHFS